MIPDTKLHEWEQDFCIKCDGWWDRPQVSGGLWLPLLFLPRLRQNLLLFFSLTEESDDAVDVGRLTAAIASYG